jgi:hypothetical protein
MPVATLILCTYQAAPKGYVLHRKVDVWLRLVVSLEFFSLIKTYFYLPLFYLDMGVRRRDLVFISIKYKYRV